MRFMHSSELGGGRHSIMAQKGVDLGLSAAEGDERLERGAASPAREHLVTEAGAGLRIEHPGLDERLVRIGGEYLGPLVAVVARRVSAREDVLELVREAVVVG